MNKKQKARRHDRRKAHQSASGTAAWDVVRVEMEIAGLEKLKKADLVTRAQELGLTVKSKDTKPMLIETITHRLRNNTEHGIAA